MEKKRRIALLNMRYDNNYGGNLQRYAMVTVLQRMGYSVEYLYIRDNWNDWFTNRSTSKIIKKTLGQVVRHILNPKNEPWQAWHKEKLDYRESCLVTESFLEKYIPHTKPIFTHRELERVFKQGQYDSIVAGSDQIWRKQYVERYGLGTWFFDFVPKDYAGNRIVYGASFGVEEAKYSKEERDLIKPLFNKINAVSVRELSGLDLLQEYGWTLPQAQCVVDPTMLLCVEDYVRLIEASETKPLSGKLFCYILDENNHKKQVVSELSQRLQLKPTYCSINDAEQVSVEQWLRYFKEAEYVVTDSYHGLVFSIIFQKRYCLINNSSRGNARFDSLFRLLNLSNNGDDVDWKSVGESVDGLRAKAESFLTNALII